MKIYLFIPPPYLFVLLLLKWWIVQALALPSGPWFLDALQLWGVGLCWDWLAQRHFYWGMVGAIATFGVQVVLSLFFYFNGGIALDYALLLTNWDALWTWDFIALLRDMNLAGPLIAASLVGVFLIGLNRYLPVFYSFKFTIPSVPWWSSTALVSLGSLLFLNHPLAFANQLLSSTWTFYQHQQAPPTRAEYPYYHHEIRPNQASDLPRRPHVFIVMVESLNTAYVEAKAANGQEVTPFINSLIPQSLYVENFFNHSVQTIRGQIAILCGILPSFREKISYSYPNLSLRCLSDILHDYGYQTYFAKAHSNLNFEQTGQFFSHRNFDFSFGMDERFVDASERPFVWGWGLQDDHFYRQFFNFTDQQRLHDPRPLFAALTTVSGHTYFNRLPAAEKRVYPQAQSTYENYVNALNASDRYLRRFFAELTARADLRDNSLVIIVGDHSYPVSPQRSLHSTRGHQQDSFRTPLLIWWPGQLAPQRIQQWAYAQIDIAPTLLELLGLRTDHHFIGESILQAPQKRAQHLISVAQPYAGTYLSTILYPYRYERHLQSGAEFLYDLQRDPLETQNLLDDRRRRVPLTTRLQLRRGLEQMDLNQYLIRNDKIYPPRIKEE